MLKCIVIKLTIHPLGLVTSDMEQCSEMFGDTSDVRVSELERLFYNCDYHAALKLEADRHHTACLPIHVALPPLEIRLEYSLTNLTRTFFSQAL